MCAATRRFTRAFEMGAPDRHVGDAATRAIIRASWTAVIGIGVALLLVEVASGPEFSVRSVPDSGMYLTENDESLPELNRAL